MGQICIECNQILSKVSRQKKYCDQKCQKAYEYKLYIENWKNGINTGVKADGVLSNYIKRYIAEKYNKQCSICSISKWMGQPITLEIDHIDGNHKNNIEDNLRLICPNCHSQTPTYRAKNVGNGRLNRRKFMPDDTCVYPHAGTSFAG